MKNVLLNVKIGVSMFGSGVYWVGLGVKTPSEMYGWYGH